jgi:hypothetical protein
VGEGQAAVAATGTVIDALDAPIPRCDNMTATTADSLSLSVGVCAAAEAQAERKGAAAAIAPSTIPFCSRCMGAVSPIDAD